MIFLPFAALFARMAIKIIPDRAIEERAIIRPRYLDDELIQVPAMALERARMELGHMGELTEAMLAKVKSAFKSGIKRTVAASMTRWWCSARRSSPTCSASGAAN